jgi:hypothetical protein
MTAGNYGYGSMRATDADRENVRQILQDAHAQGRLSWDEFDSRSTALVNAQTYSQLTELTSDLPNRIPGTPPQAYQQYGQPFGGQPFGGQPFGGQPFGARATNGLAIAALVCAICQVFFWFVTGIPAIVLGHLARRQIRQTGEAGDGMALAALIFGYVGLALAALFVVILVVIAVAAVNHGGPNPGGVNPPLPQGP